MSRLLVLAALALTPILGHAAQSAVVESFPDLSGYVVALPPTYAAKPVDNFATVIFFHGMGERTSDPNQLLNMAKKHGPNKLIAAGNTTFDNRSVVVISPILAAGKIWSWQNVCGFIDKMDARYRIDRNRLCLTGLSLGGGGVVEAGRTNPGRFSALLPICQTAPVSTASLYPFGTVPTWFFHNWGDPTVSKYSSTLFADAMAAERAGGASATTSSLAKYPHVNGNQTLAAATTMTGGFVVGGTWTWTTGRVTQPGSALMMTLYNSNSHDAWTATYNDPAVWNWLLGQTRAGPTVAISGPESVTVNGVFHATAAAVAPAGRKIVNITWKSDRDGVLGTGAVLDRDLSLGRHLVTVTAKDDRDRTVTDHVVVDRQAASASRVIFDLGSPYLYIEGGNNITDPVAGSVIAAKDVLGQTTTIGATVIDAFTNSMAWGVQSAALYDLRIGTDALWCQRDVNPTAAVRLSGLNPTQSYDLRLYASRDATDDRTTIYRVADQERSLQVAGNTSRTADFIGIRPAADGTLVIEVRPGGTSQFGYLGVIDLTPIPGGAG